MNVFIHTNGCAARQLDSSRLVKYFTLNECKIVTEPQAADYIIFVTCSGAKFLEEDCWKYINEFKRYSGELIILGCLPSIALNFNQEFKGRYLATKNLSEIDKFFERFKVRFSDIPDSSFFYHGHFAFGFKHSILREFKQEIRNLFKNFAFSKYFFKKHLLFIKNIISQIIHELVFRKIVWFRIGGGCQGSCSYCAVSRAIGRLTSKPIEVCVDEYRRLLDKGFRKFVILGDDTGAYGLDIKSSFAELLENLSIASGKRRVYWHLEHMHPLWICRYKTTIARMVKEKKIRRISACIQSGSNRILKLMNRRHTIEEITDVLLQLKECNPNLKLRTEVIVGFPSETEEDFSATLEALKKIRFNYIFSFPYDDGYETLASKMDNKVSQGIIKQRLKIMKDFEKRENLLADFLYDW